MLYDDGAGRLVGDAGLKIAGRMWQARVMITGCCSGNSPPPNPHRARIKKTMPATASALLHNLRFRLYFAPGTASAECGGRARIRMFATFRAIANGSRDIGVLEPDGEVLNGRVETQRQESCACVGVFDLLHPRHTFDCWSRRARAGDISSGCDPE